MTRPSYVAELDPAAGIERTALAWQRTALALVAGSAILTRLTFDRLGSMSLMSAVIAGPVGVWIFLESRLRYRRGVGVRRPRRSRGGRAPFLLAAATSTVALTELLAMVEG